MNIYLREMKANRKSLIIWSVVMILFIVSGMGKYAGYKSSGQSINELMAKLPRVVRLVLGIGDFDLSKASGFYGMLFFYLLLIVAIHAVILGAGIISKEERDKTSEFLFVKPASRHRIVTSKLLAALTNIFILNIVTLLSSIVIFDSVSKGERINTEIITMMIALFIVQLIFLFIGSATASAIKKSKPAISLAAGIMLFTFILSIFIDASDFVALNFLTPFKYYPAADIIKGNGLAPIYIALSLVIIGVLFYSTYFFFKKRDLNI